jgi:uncharacterized protein YdaU (DUF1376 family)
MHYYQFNIGDYASHTAFLEPMEDLAYRRMLDWCYLNEMPLPKDVGEIGILIRMRSHTECIATVLRYFFTKQSDGYVQQRVLLEVAAYREKSEKAKKSAEARWKKKPNKHAVKGYANALQTDCEGNAKHKTRTIKQEPATSDIGADAPPPEKQKRPRFIEPSVEEVRSYCQERGNTIDPQKFVDHYSANGWMRGKTKIKDWKACVRTWEGNQRASPAQRPAKGERSLEEERKLQEWLSGGKGSVIEGEYSHEQQ